MAAAPRLNSADAGPDGSSRAWMAPPREFPPQSAAELAALVAQADRVLLRLDGALSALPSPEPYMAMHRRREAVLSATLAGFPSSLAAVLTARTAADSDGGAAHGCLRAIEIAAMRTSASPFSRAEVAKLHAALEGSIRAGVPQAVEPDRRPADGERLRRVTEILNGCRQSPEKLPPLVRIGLALGQIESWRPFPQACGRMGRALVPALAEQLGVPGAQALGLSGFLVMHSSAYRQARLGIESASEWSLG